MEKDQIVRRVTQLASERGGHISFRAFIDASGITERWLRDQPWFSGWNALLEEIGLSTKSFKVNRTPKERIAEAVAELAMCSSRWPTEDDLRRERRRNSAFPSVGTISPLRKTGELAHLILKLAESQPRLAPAALIAANHARVVESEVLPDEKIKGYVYMLRSGRRYKIGKSTDPSRRFREVRLELPEETNQVHTIATDDPTGIEAYWHQRFAEKRVRNTEFFELTAEDVRAFKRRKYQ